MGDATQFVRLGSYIDWGRSARRQYLLPDLAANTLTTFLGILVTIAWARLWKIFGRIYDRTGCKFLKRSEGYYETPIDKNVLENTIESEGFHRVLEAVKNMREFPGQVALDNSDIPRYRDMVVGVILMLVYVGINACGVVTTFLATDRVALSAHPDCGLWVENSTAVTFDDRPESFKRTLPLLFRKQIESATWAENCYVPSAKPDGCSFFLNREIEYESFDDLCPFQDLCYNSSSALTLTTGAVDARVLGINAPKTYEFRRSATCSPLNMNSTFVRLVNEDSCARTFRYYYGPSFQMEDATWQTTFYGEDGGNQLGYSFDMFPSGITEMWKPIPQLEPPKSSTTTLMFINSGQIFYVSPSYDPIFPATTSYETQWGNQYYRNTRGHAGVLACIERTEIRDPTISQNWTSVKESQAPGTKDPQSRGGYWFLRFSLLYSSIFLSANDRSGDALDAQKLISARISMPIEIEQWKVEVRQLFEASLARIQVEAKDIARGTAAGYPGYYKIDPVGAEICEKTYLFNSVGYTNVNMIGYIWIASLCTFFIILGIPWTKEKFMSETFILDPVLEFNFREAADYGWVLIFGRDGFFANAWRIISGWLREDGFLRETMTKIPALLHEWAVWRPL